MARLEARGGQGAGVSVWQRGRRLIWARGCYYHAELSTADPRFLPYVGYVTIAMVSRSSAACSNLEAGKRLELSVQHCPQSHRRLTPERLPPTQVRAAGRRGRVPPAQQGAFIDVVWSCSMQCIEICLLLRPRPLKVDRGISRCSVPPNLPPNRASHNTTRLGRPLHHRTTIQLELAFTPFSASTFTLTAHR